MPAEEDLHSLRPWSEHELVISHPPVRRGYFSRFGDAFCIENYNISRSGYLLKFHRILRLPLKMIPMIDTRDIWNVIYNARSNKHYPPQPHQILRLPRKMTLMIDLRHIWNVISNARSNRHLPPTWPNTAPATQKCTPKSKRNSPRTVEAPIPMRGRFDHDPTMIRTWSEHDPTMNSSSRTRPFAEVTFPPSATHFVLKITTFRAPAIYSNFTEYCACHENWRSKITKYCACHAKWLSWLMSVTHDTSFTMRGATDLILQHHQMLRLPRKMTRIIYPRDIWNVIYNARSNKHHPPTSPNAAPATKNDAHHWLSSHMKRHLQCAEQQASPSNLTKYCACHAKLHSKIKEKFAENSWSVISNARPIRAWSDHDPTMIRTWSDHEIAKLNPSVRRAYFSPLGNAFCIENYNISRSGYLPRFHRILRLPRKMTLMIDVRHTWHVIYNARSNRSHPPTSPNAAPATQNDSHHLSSWHMKRYLQCAEQQASPSNLTKCCPCHEKWCASLIVVAYETSFTMRVATGITLQPHQILRLPRKMTRIIYPRDIWNVISNARSNRHLPPTWPNTAPATQSCTPKTKKNAPKTAEASIPMRGRFEHDPSMIRPWSDHELVISHPPVRGGYFSPLGNAFCIENYNISRSGYLLKFHRILRLPRELTLQDHQILRLPRKMTLMIDVRHTWHVIYNARSNRSHPPTSPNAAPATQNDSHHLSSWHMKRYLQCAEQQASPSNLTKCCPCHEKWCASLIVVAYETSFTMRVATGITLQPHQILRLPRKIAPQKQRKMRRKQLKRQFQCGDDSSMIRAWSDHELVISHPPVRGGYFSRFGDAFCIENYNISRSGYLPRFHRILRLPRKVPLQDDEILRLPRKVTLQDHQILRLPRKVTLRHHQILRLPRKVTMLLNCYWTELLLSCYWAVTKLLLSCYWTVTELTCYWTVTGLSLNCYWTDLLLSCYWPVTELSCYWTDLWLNCYWTVTELTCYWAVTDLLLNWAVTQLLLDCYWTELILNWPVTERLLTCYWTELLLNCYWTVTELTCYWTVTELLLLLHCYLNCYCTGLFAFLNLRNSEVSQLNFLW